MDEAVIDDNIVLIAKNLANGVSEQDIIDVFKEAKYQDDDIFLLLSAGKILCQDRKNTPPKQGVFRRVE